MKRNASKLHLRRLDEALVALLQERARFCIAHNLQTDAAAVQDLLRRADGSLPAPILTAVFGALKGSAAPEVTR